ncbi:MAG TPA: hypothetical protein VHO24_00770 [Opitutaceae bacterium]|nr:hypothetical protein [Opitutaceae bacterium]
MLLALVSPAGAAPVDVSIPASAPSRVAYGASKIVETLKAVGVDAQVRDAIGGGPQKTTGDLKVRIVSGGSEATNMSREGFVLTTDSAGTITVAGADGNGTLYGCLELARRIKEEGKLPGRVQFSDAPVFILRGPCIGMQKTFILPGRKVYEYPYTPELFPFFYYKNFWREYLDFLVGQRMNTLYLWNGHPFASLVRLPDYPEAVEVSDEVFQRNVEMFRYIAEEADRRGIWVVQQFYSIILSKPFAEKHGLQTQLAASTPVVDDYMRKSVAEFVKQFPNVGLMPCLGEALQGQDNQTRWLTDVILAGVKDGMEAAGLKEEPPVILRTHATEARAVMPSALKVYRNLYTEAKFNGESLTTYEPRGVRQELHLAMSKLGSTHLINVHILANLEPFRYGAQRFIQKSMQAARDRLGAKGVHLYPLFYWNWPDSPDITQTPLKQWERDWIWFEAWARYAWNPDIDATTDRAYWLGRLTDFYGSREAAAHILDAYNDAGECAPRILRRFGITEGNRQTMSLGMTLDELVNPAKYREFPELWESQSPPGERLREFAERDWKKQPHEGETPPQIIAEILDFSARAAAAIDAAAPAVTKNREEFLRLRNDIHCIRAMSQNFAAKAGAALLVLRHGFSREAADMERAEALLAESFAHYRTLAALTEKTYTAANSMQTAQRRIPVPGGISGKPANYHWTQLLPLYETELTDFKRQVAALKTPGAAGSRTHAPLTPAAFTLLSKSAETYTLQVGNTVFSDAPFTITALAPELQGLTGIRFSHETAKAGSAEPIEFSCAAPVRVLVGYFDSRETQWRKAPTLETDASAADRGGAEPLLIHGAAVESLPPINVHAFEYGPGRHKLEVRGTGSFVVLGVVAVPPAPGPR